MLPSLGGGDRDPGGYGGHPGAAGSRSVRESLYAVRRLTDWLVVV